MKYILIFLNNPPRQVLTHTTDRETAEAAYLSLLDWANLRELDVQAKFELDEHELPDGLYITCLEVDENNKMIYNFFSVLRCHLSAHWFPIRENLFKDLDLKYLRADEAENQSEKRSIIKRKNYLRDIPDFIFRKIIELIGTEKALSLLGLNELPEKASTINNLENLKKIFRESISKEELFQITPFYNIFEIEVLDGGAGYITPPEIKIKCSEGFQFAPVLEVELDSGSIKLIKVISPGCGYISYPVIKISPPTGEGGRMAALSIKIENKTRQE